LKLTYKYIVKTATDMLLAKFPTIEVQASDVEQGFQRPSFYVITENAHRESYRYYSVRTMDIVIYFFPTSRDNYAIEMLDTQQKLEELFDQNIIFGNRVVPILNTEHQIVDKVLEFTIAIEYYEEPFDDGAQAKPIMKELNVNV
jgi:hypothetical protein